MLLQLKNYCHVKLKLSIFLLFIFSALTSHCWLKKDSSSSIHLPPDYHLVLQNSQPSWLGQQANGDQTVSGIFFFPGHSDNVLLSAGSTGVFLGMLSSFVTLQKFIWLK